MENARKFLPVIIGGVVAIVVFFISRKVRQSGGNNQERSQNLEKTPEAKTTKSIFKKIKKEN